MLYLSPSSEVTPIASRPPVEILSPVKRRLIFGLLVQHSQIVVRVEYGNQSLHTAHHYLGRHRRRSMDIGKEKEDRGRAHRQSAGGDRSPSAPPRAACRCRALDFGLGEMMDSRLQKQFHAPGNLSSGQGTQELPVAFELLQSLRTDRALREMREDSTPLIGRESIIQVRTEQPPTLTAGHVSILRGVSCSSARRSCSRARAKRERTVPSGTRRILAI